MYFSVPGTQVRIAGTMHMLPADAPLLPSWLWDAYTWSEQVLIESNPSEILPYLPLNDGTSLPQHLPAACWDALHAIVTGAGIPDAQLHSWKPWAALLAMEAALQAYAPGVEAQFLAQAQPSGKPVFMLETGAAIAQLLDQVPLEVITDYMSDTLDAPQRACARARLLHQAWLQRSLPAMYEVVRDTPIFQTPALKHAILSARNQAWLARLRLALQAPQRTLIVVGALHLCGPGSLVELLALEGVRLLEERGAD